MSIEASQGRVKIQKPYLFKSNLALSVGLAMAANSYAAVTYTGLETLTNSSTLSSPSNAFPGISGNGVFDNDTTGANININYSSGDLPFYVLGGYAQGTPNTGFQNRSASQNNVTLTQGSIDGNIYAGLVHITLNPTTTPCSSCNISIYDANNTLESSRNAITLEANNPITINGNLYSGYAESNINPGTLEILYISNQSNSLIAANNTLTTNNNSTLIEGENHQINNSITGHAKNIAHAVVTTFDPNNQTFHQNAQSNINYANAKITSTNNAFSIKGNNNRLTNTTTGHADFEIDYGIFTAGTAYISDVWTPGNLSGIIVTPSANAEKTTNAYNQTSLTENNKSYIEGDSNTLENIVTGHAGFTITSVSTTAGNATGTANGTTNGSIPNTSATVFTNSSTKNTSSTYNNSLSAINNTILMAGNSNIFKTATSGSAITTLTSGNQTSASATGTAISTTQSIGNGSASAEIITLAYDNKFQATGNKVEIKGNNNTVSDHIKSGRSAITIKHANLTAGEVILNAGTISTTNASAKASLRVDSSTIISDDNTILIEGAGNTISSLTAGHSSLDISIGNIKAGTITANYLPSSALASLDVNASNTKLTASQNIITLNGSSTVKGNIHTGYIDFIIDHSLVLNGDGSSASPTINLAGSSASATNNTINISGEHVFTDNNATLYGGYLNYSAATGYKPETYDVFRGNTLNYANKTPISIDEVANFQAFNFTLNPALVNTGTPLITAKSIVLGSDANNVSDGAALASDIKVVAIHSGQVLPLNSKFILMQADPSMLTGLGQGYLTRGVAEQGISLLYDVETIVDKPNDQVYAVINAVQDPTPPTDPEVLVPIEPKAPPTDPEVLVPIEPKAPPTGPRVNPRSKAILQGNLAGLMLLSRGADQNLFAGISDQNNKRGLKPFIIASGNHTRYDTGSHIKSDGALMSVGFSYQDEQLTSALYVEGGWDSYKTHNEFKDALRVKGSGHNRFSGLGAFAHYDFDNGWYIDGMVRGGRLHTNFETNDLVNAATGERAEYNIRTTYMGATLTGGHVLPVDEQNNVDLSAKYTWVGTSGKKQIVAGDPIHFKGLDSQRVRLQAINHYTMTPEVTVLAGLGYEYEFDAKAKGTTYEIYDLDSPSLKGSTGLATLGMLYVPAANDRFSMDLRGNGYFGKREGASLTMKLEYEF